ncbi:patatin-like phospholipase family protein [Curtobacterium sp. RRHDQ10]|uniref:patatin-like phospholipase family protein n=1 Tax=Curtobacterium phyllosphaerae TaxID=3413379 RepID=UPI003BF03ED3
MTYSIGQQRTAIVFGGGGVAGIAWELGLTSGLLDAGVPLADADLVVGTSAGSVVGALLRSGAVEETYRQQLAPMPSSYREPVRPDWDAIGELLAERLRGVRTDDGGQEARARVGALALEVTAGQTPGEREATFAETLPSGTWPSGALAVCAVDAVDGAFRVFTAADGVPLTRAVAASCSVPLVWSPVDIGGRSHIDGGARSATNADAASGYDRVLVVACRPEQPSPTGPWLDVAVQSLRSSGSEVLVVVADDASQAAYGTDVLAVSTRGPAATAGRAQAAAVAAEVGAFWSAAR